VSFRLIPAALFAVALLGAGSRPAPLIVYSAPAGDRPAGADRIHPTDAILPNGRIAAPAGNAIFIGTAPLGITLTPDARYAIVANAGTTLAGGVAPMLGLTAGYSLAVVDPVRMRLASTYSDPASAFFMGIAAARDPGALGRTIVLAGDPVASSVRVFDLDGQGTLTPERTIALPPQSGRRVFPGPTWSRAPEGSRPMPRSTRRRRNPSSRPQPSTRPVRPRWP
jgi:hypothetical protein